MTSADAALRVREAAALEVLRRDPGTDRLALLAAVVWPAEQLVAASEGSVRRRQPLSRDEVTLILELRRQGLSFAQVATRVGRPASTCKEAARRHA